jgi:hypothetical protein
VQCTPRTENYKQLCWRTRLVCNAVSGSCARSAIAFARQIPLHICFTSVDRLFERTFVVVAALEMLACDGALDTRLDHRERATGGCAVRRAKLTALPTTKRLNSPLSVASRRFPA